VSFEACAALVEKGDPDRFLATMAAPVAVRRVLFPLYAFNVEVARAPWVTQEPMIAEMRLQWWRDALEEIANGGPVRKHEVTTALAEVLDAEGARTLDGLVAARRWDIYKDAFEDDHHFEDYLNATTGGLMWTAVRLALAEHGIPVPERGPAGLEDNVKRFAYGVGIANWLRAVPELAARGRIPLLDGTTDGVRVMALNGLHDMRAARATMKNGKLVQGPVAEVLRVGWRARTTLERVRKNPTCVSADAMDESPLARRTSLLWKTLRGTY